jgi:hypothetical protein
MELAHLTYESNTILTLNIIYMWCGLWNESYVIEPYNLAYLNQNRYGNKHSKLEKIPHYNSYLMRDRMEQIRYV